MPALLALLAIEPHPASDAWVKQLRDGDVIFHTSRSAQSVAIQRATGSRYSHMGMVLMRGGQPCVFEAIATVRCTPVRRWVARGEGGHFVVKRLRDASRTLGPQALERLRVVARQFEGRAYDARFGWSDEKIYCSELVWKVYDRALGIKLSEPRRVRDFNLTDPVVGGKAHERFGSTVPLDEPAVAPSDLFASGRLVPVLER